MRGYSTLFQVPKDGSAAESCEDYASVNPAPGPDGDFDTRRLRAAIADGASEAMLSRLWARQLVESYLTMPIAGRLSTSIGTAVSQWDTIVQQHTAARHEEGRPILWYEEPGLAKGSYATILAVRFIDRSPPEERCGIFDAWAMGDSCLFQVRDENVECAFPIFKSSDFSSGPMLVPSRPQYPALIAKHLRHWRGAWRQGDEFYLMTDALACWFLLEIESGNSPWTVLRDLGTEAVPDGFNDWVAKRRQARSLCNDDTTLLRIDVD